MTTPITEQMPINVSELPGLQAALWDRRESILPAEQVFHLYEDRWRYIDSAQFSDEEKVLLEQLIMNIGNEVFLAH